ncbi:MAG: penicillin acylase family protein, partial [Longimicrobiales bacterium]
MKRLLVLVVLLAQPALVSGQRALTLPRARTEILWDRYGVPHVYARDGGSLFYAFGWAQMQNHGNLVLRLYGQARGRAAEYWGEEFLESDHWVRTNGIPARADRWYRQTRSEYRGYIDAFVAGMNAYAAENAAQLSAAERVVLP